jgi:hypothetical protein
MIKSISPFARISVSFAIFLSSIIFSGTSLANVSCVEGGQCTQTIALVPGWNAIYVQVEPNEGATEVVFSDLVDETGPQINSVWTWLAHRSKIDFIQDPDSENLLSAAGWLRYFPPQAQQSFLTNLFAVSSNRAYLVNLAGSENATLTISGKPVVPKANWEPESFNLTGFHIDPTNPPTFSDFMASSPAHKGQPIYRLINNSWHLVDALTTPIEPGVAYWIFSQAGSDFTGPLDVDLPQLNRLEYSTTLESLTPRLKNNLQSAQAVSVKIIGDALGMFYPNEDLSADQRWLALPSSLNSTIPAGGELRFPLGVRRADFTPENFNQTLEVIGTAGSRWLIPVSASAPKLNSLWIGTVTIDQVSQVQNYRHDCDIEAYDVVTSEVINGEPVLTTTEFPAQTFALCTDEEGIPITKDAGNVLTPVADEFSFRVIMHRDGTQVRLLKDVIQMRKKNLDGTVGDYVLLTDDSLIADYTGIVLRDGEAVGKRVSTMAYDFGLDDSGTEITSMDMDGGGSLYTHVTFQLNLAATAPTNPFGHIYHAQHGKKIIDGQVVSRAYALNRKMEFTFESIENGLGAGYDVKGGTYREVVDGLHKLPIIAAGTFTLRHAAQIDKLNQ